MDRVDEQLKAEVARWAAYYDHRLKLGNKPIFHLEGWSFICTSHRWQVLHCLQHSSPKSCTFKSLSSRVTWIREMRKANEHGSCGLPCCCYSDCMQGRHCYNKRFMTTICRFPLPPLIGLPMSKRTSRGLAHKYRWACHKGVSPIVSGRDHRSRMS